MNADSVTKKYSIIFLFIYIYLFNFHTSAVWSVEMSDSTVQAGSSNEKTMQVGRSDKGIIEKGDTFNLNQIMEIGLKWNPARSAALNTVEVNKSKVGQARANYFPQIALSSNINRISGPVVGPGIGYFPGTQTLNVYTAGVNINQNIFDSWKTPSSVDVAKFNLEAARSDLDTATSQIVLNIKQAYYGVLQAKWSRGVAMETVKQMSLHLDQTQAFYKAGTHPKIDATKAELDLSNAKLNMIKTENDLKIAWVNLNNAIGIPDAPEYSIEDNLAFQKYTAVSDNAVNEAYANRPELKSIKSQERAAEYAISSARSNYGPAITGSVMYGYSGVTFPLQSGWLASLGISMPLFSGFLTTYQINEAKSTLRVLKANEEALRQQILLDIRQAFLNLEQAEDSISTAQLAVKQAEENLDLAKNRYTTGVGNPVEVSDAFASYTNAQSSYITSLYNYKIAQAFIEKAIGFR